MTYESHLWTYRTEVDEVIDGDTLRLHVDLGMRTHAAIDVRLADCWAPEANTPEGEQAAMFAAAWLNDHGAAKRQWPMIVRTMKRTRDPNDDRERQSFTRYVGSIFCRQCSSSLAEALIGAGHATQQRSDP